MKRNQQLVFTGERDRTQLALSSSKVFMLFFDQSWRSKNSVCFDILTLGHSSEGSAKGDTGQKSIFWVCFWSWLQQTRPEGTERSCPFGGNCPAEGLTSGSSGPEETETTPWMLLEHHQIFAAVWAAGLIHTRLSNSECQEQRTDWTCSGLTGQGWTWGQSEVSSPPRPLPDMRAP